MLTAEESLSMDKYDGMRIRPTKARPFLIVGQSQASAYGEAIGSCTYGIATLEDAIARTAEGGYVVDKRELPWEVACKCITGPMSRVALPPMTASYVYVDSVTFSTMQDFHTYLEKNNPTYLSLDLYAAYWQKLGAKVGRVVKGKVVWE